MTQDVTINLRISPWAPRWMMLCALVGALDSWVCKRVAMLGISARS